MEFTKENEVRLQYLTDKIAQLRIEQRVLNELQAGRIKTQAEFDAHMEEIADRIEPQERDLYVKAMADARIREAEEKAESIMREADERLTQIAEKERELQAQERTKQQAVLR